MMLDTIKIIRLAYKQVSTTSTPPDTIVMSGKMFKRLEDRQEVSEVDQGTPRLFGMDILFDQHLRDGMFVIYTCSLLDEVNNILNT